MTDITVSRELLRQVLNEYEFAFAPTVATKALRAALDAEPAPVQEPVAFVSPDDLEDMRGPEYAAGAYFRMRATPAGKYVQPIYTAPQPDRIAQLEAAEKESQLVRNAALEEAAKHCQACSSPPPGETQTDAQFAALHLAQQIRSLKS